MSAIERRSRLFPLPGDYQASFNLRGGPVRAGGPPHPLLWLALAPDRARAPGDRAYDPRREAPAFRKLVHGE